MEWSVRHSFCPICSSCFSETDFVQTDRLPAGMQRLVTCPLWRCKSGVLIVTAESLVGTDVVEDENGTKK